MASARRFASMISLKKTTETLVDQAKHVPTTASRSKKLLVKACKSKHANAPQSRGKIEYPNTQTLWKKLMRPPRSCAFNVTMAAPAQTCVEINILRRVLHAIDATPAPYALVDFHTVTDDDEHRGEDQCALTLGRARRQGY